MSPKSIESISCIVTNDRWIP